MNTENNKIIAEFLGYDTIVGITVVSVIKHNQLMVFNPNSDWNWLMEVVEKINLLEDFKYSVTIQTMDCYISDDKGKKIVSIDCRYNVDELKKSVYNACLAFINWHNEQK